MKRNVESHPDWMPASSPYTRRLQETDRKLCEALNRLMSEASREAASPKERHLFSVANLAREAGVARNAIYTNHRKIIETLRQAAQRRIMPRELESRQDKLAQQRAVIELLKAEQRRLATENASLLKRAIEADAVAARHQRQNARLLKERDEACRLVAFVQRPGT